MIEIYADGADIKGIKELNNNPLISGFTTNPSLLKKSGVTNYKDFAIEVLEHVREKPVSFEVISDNFGEMKEQAEIISSWGGDNIFVKIPITNTAGKFTTHIISDLSSAGIKINITAIFTIDQINQSIQALNNKIGIISIFAGRIEDTGVDARPSFEWAKRRMYTRGCGAKLLWASTREIFSIIKAEQCGADIITVPNNILEKLPLRGKNLKEYSLDTVKQFYRDATESGFTIC